MARKRRMFSVSIPPPHNWGHISTVMEEEKIHTQNLSSQQYFAQAGEWKNICLRVHRELLCTIMFADV
jgi:hypothetical protein